MERHSFAMEIKKDMSGYRSLVTFREVFFVNKVHRKPESCGAKSCKA